MNTAERIIKPTLPGIFRAVFLYTGQGESTLLVIPNGPTKEDYLYVLVDSDRDKEENEIDLVDFFNDLFKNGGSLSTFINTHPHNDHIGGIKEVYDTIGFKEVWHSNHKSGGKHKKKYEEFAKVVKAVGKENEYFLLGTKDLNKVRASSDKEVIKKLGQIDYQVLSPAEYLCDDIEEGTANERDDRIHEQCGVIKFTYGKNPKSILITGDSDKVAWQNHITNYHKKSLSADVLSASHHGSYTFFKNTSDDEDVYEDHISAIKPAYVVISAPKQSDSPHGHPHDEAVELYKKHGAEILHLGKNVESIIVDIDADGKISINPDKELIETYGKGDEDGDDAMQKSFIIPVAAKPARLDEKPMGSSDAMV